MKKCSSLLLTTAFLTTVLSFPVHADNWHGREGWHGPDNWHGGDWRGYGDIHGFREYGFDHWRGGNWFNGYHEGRNGWWWIVDGSWYFYPAPIYPYPDPYTPPNVVVETVQVSPTGALPSYVYYCPNPAGYYPYIAECPVTWQKVASSSPAPTTPAQPQVVFNQPPQSTAAASPTGSARDADLQQVNLFSTKLQNIDLQDSHAKTKLTNLAKQVETFRQSLYSSNYNAMDIMKDAEDLEHRIADKKSSLAKHKDSPAPVSASPTVAPPAPTSPPPGTPVTFPPNQ